MNPILSVFLKDFLIVPDEVVDGLYAGAKVVICGWKIEVAEHIAKNGHEQLFEEIRFHTGRHFLIARAIVFVILKHQVKHVVPVQITCL